MKILNFTNPKQIPSWISRSVQVFLLIFLFGSAVTAESNGCTMICNGDLHVQVSGEDCKSKIGFHDLIPNPCFHDGYKVQILTLNNYLIKEGWDHVTVELVGKFIYKVTHKIDGKDVTCWGHITFEDKDGPVKNFTDDIPEPRTTVCDSPNQPDPSGLDDLKHEFVSCVVLEKYGKDGIEPWFDELDKEDFKDCTGVKDVFSFDNKFDLCDSKPKPQWMEDEMIKLKPGFPKGWEPCYVFKRSWFASDKNGRLSDTCFQLVVVLRPPAKKIHIDKYVKAECGADTDEVKKQGYPYFIDLENTPNDFLTCPKTSYKKVYLPANAHFCKYGVSVNFDEKVPLCNTDGSKVYQQTANWTVTDWCTGYPIIGNWGEDKFDNFTNTIKIEDTIDPILEMPTDIEKQTDLFDCTGSIHIGPAIVKDCVGAVEFETTAEYLKNAYDPYNAVYERKTQPINGIWLGGVPLETTIKVTHRAWDACGNTGEVSYEIKIEDDRPPVCISNDEIIVSMIRVNPEDPLELGTRIYGEDLDDTSRDNCFPLIKEIRRADEAAASDDPESLWARYIEFTDEDLTEDGGCKGKVKVEIRITENRYGKRGLSSTCWADVVLEDKNPPVTSIGDDKYALCTEPKPKFDELQIVGCFDGVDMVVDTPFYDECNYDKILEIRKTWTPYRLHHGVKQKFPKVQQSIVIGNVHDSKFTFPLDVKLDCSLAKIPEPTKLEDILEEEGCADWLMQVTDTEYESSDPDACYKILRRYTFINWCTWNPSNTELAVVKRPRNGVWSDGDQVVLHFMDADRDGVNDVDDADDGDRYDIERSEMDHLYDGAWVHIDTGDEVDGQDVYNHTEDINGEETTSLDGYQYGYFSYTQVIKIQDKEDPTFSSHVKIDCDPLDTDCELPRSVKITFTGQDNCSDITYSSYIQVNQELPTTQDHYGTIDGNRLTGRYPVGTHNLIVKAEDACGNHTQDTIKLEIRGECKKPTPICYATFTAAMEDGTVEIWASDVESGSSSDNCTAYEDLDFFIELLKDINEDGYINEQDVSASIPSTKSVTLTCDNIYDYTDPQNKGVVALWAIDEAGNTQFCLAPVIVADNDGICKVADTKVAGKIVNEEDEDIDDVMVKVSGSSISPDARIFNGVFDFLSIPMHSDVTVVPEKDHGYLNGVSTSDLVLLQRHILGVNPLGSAYKMIAADANADNKVDTRDMLHLSRLILGVYAELPNATSWRFVDKEYTFTDPTAPWGFPEAVTFNDIDDEGKADFIGVKIGDLSGNAKPSNLLGESSPIITRNVALTTENKALESGEETTITLKAQDMVNVAGYQFTISMDESLQLTGFDFGPNSELSEPNVGLSFIDENLITVSWSKAYALDFEDGTDMISLKVIASTATTVQQVIQLNSAYTPAEAYDQDLNDLGIVLNVISSDESFELYQNIPNPVSNETSIGFNLPEAGKASLRIIDVSGKVIKRVEKRFEAGYNQISFDRSELGAAGVLYYQLESNQHSASKKMIILD